MTTASVSPFAAHMVAHVTCAHHLGRCDVKPVRDYAAEYIAAREDSRRPGVTLTQRADAWEAADKIERAARRAGVDLDVIDLDEQARHNLYGPYVWTPAATS